MLRRFGREFLQRYPQPPGVVRTLRSLAACRTAALGGQVTRCRQCGQVTYHYHSCGDRHCPQCGGSKRALWLAQRQADLLPAPYFHVVFTLPHELSALALGNRRLLYGLLFEAAAETLLEVAANPRHLGARVGVLAVLHTWGQQLEHHAHVHCVVPGGGLACDGAGVLAQPPRWLSCRPNWFLPVKVLSQVFRGKYLAKLRAAHERGDVHVAGSTAALAKPACWRAWLGALYQKPWVVYAKEPFGGPEQVLKYLTGYTHRVALSNRRLLKLEGDRVTLSWKDYRDGCQRKQLALEAVELLRRFSLHVLPRRLVRIRQYGLLANRDRKERLARCRELLGAERATAPSTDGGPSPLAAEPARPPLPSAALVRACLLAVLLPLVLPAAVAVPAAAAPLGNVVVEPRCASCGGYLETIWQAERPRGKHRGGPSPWDSS